METLIKMFRKKVADEPFATVLDANVAFLEFLKATENKNDIDSYEKLSELALSIISEHAYYQRLEDGSYELTQQYLMEGISGSLEKIEVPKELLALIEDNADALNSLIYEEISAMGMSVRIDESVDFAEFIKHCLSRNLKSGMETGIVCFGFGETEKLPSMLHTTIDGDFDNVIRCWRESHNDMNKPSSPKSIINTFAQADMVKLFMEGISPDIFSALVDSMNEHVDEEIMTKVFDSFHDEILTRSVIPIVNSVRLLPKEEMAIIAESLVDLTSLRRKMDSDVRTVGGPVDVAVISKGDGFIWLKRKHYFDPALNPDFATRKGRS